MKIFAHGEEPVVVVPVVVDPVQIEVPAVVIVPQIRDVAVTVHVRLGAERTVSKAIQITTPFPPLAGSRLNFIRGRLPTVALA